MSKNIKSSPLNLIGGLVQAAGAYDWGGKRKKAIESAQGEYDEMKNKFQGLDTSNLYSDVSNPYANMQNTMEDLTVNQQQAQSIGQQESANQKATAQQAGRLQQQERQGAYSADMTRRQGAVDSRNLVKDKTNTLMAMSANDLSQKESAHQQAQQQLYAGIGSAVSGAVGMAIPGGGLM